MSLTPVAPRSSAASQPGMAITALLGAFTLNTAMPRHRFTETLGTRNPGMRKLTSTLAAVSVLATLSGCASTPKAQDRVDIIMCERWSRHGNAPSHVRPQRSKHLIRLGTAASGLLWPKRLRSIEHLDEPGSLQVGKMTAKKLFEPYPLRRFVQMCCCSTTSTHRPTGCRSA